MGEEVNELREWIVKQKNKASDAAYKAEDERTSARHEGERVAFHDVEKKLVESGLIDCSSDAG